MGTLLKKKIFTRGFTLIELLTVFAISAMIAAVVVTSYPDFSSRVEFDNLALDIALTLREAQSYGMGTKGTSSSQFDVPYGVYFDTSSPSQFISFVDTNPNGVYDAGIDTALQTFVIKSKFKINTLSAGGLPATALTVSFKRPNPDAVIKAGGTSYATGSVEVIEIKTNATKTITVTDTGQISVQ